MERWCRANRLESHTEGRTTLAGRILSAEAPARVPEDVKVVEGWLYGLADVGPDQFRDRRRIANLDRFPAVTLTALAP